MRNTIERRGFLRLCGGGSLIGLAGYASGDQRDNNSRESEPGSQNVQEGGTLNLISSTVSTLDPIQSTDSVSADKINKVYENLTYYQSGTPPVENQLIDSVDISPDLLTYTFHLKQGVTYHDNPVKTEVTAHDFKYSFRRLAEASASERANFILSENFLGVEHDEDGSGVVPNSLAIDIIDDYTFEMTLVTPNPRALDILAYPSFGVMPEGLVGDIQGYSGEYTQQEIASAVMVGTGPFEFETWESGSETRMTAFDDYHGEGPYVDALHWEVITEDSAIWTYAMNKNADVFAIPTGQYDPDLINSTTDGGGREVGQYGPVDNGALLHYTGVTTFDTFYVAFNAPQVPRPVRRAVALVTDHEELIDQVFKGRGQEAFSFTPPGMWPGGFDAYTNFRDNWPYGRNSTNISEAETVLNDAGYTSEDPFELTLTIYASNTFQQFGRLTRDKLSGIGVSLQLEEAPFSTLIQRGQNGELAFYSLGWLWSWFDPAYGLQGLEPDNTDTDRIPGDANGFYLDWNAVQSSNVTKAQNAWDRIENNPAPPDQGLRNQSMVEMEEARRDDMVLLPLFHGYQETFRYRWVRGPRPGALGRSWQQYNTVWISPTGTATGTVTDADGNSLTGADIEFVDTGTGETEVTAATDGNGEYTIELPANTTYEATASKTGHELETTTVTVAENDTHTADFTLPLGEIAIAEVNVDSNVNGAAAQGETVTLTATIANTGTDAASSDPVFELRDPSDDQVRQEAATISTIEAGGETTVTATVTFGTDLAAGGDEYTYTFTLDAVDETASGTIALYGLGDVDHSGSAGPLDASNTLRSSQGLDSIGDTFNPAAGAVSGDDPSAFNAAQVLRLSQGLDPTVDDWEEDTTVTLTTDDTTE